MHLKPSQLIIGTIIFCTLLAISATLYFPGLSGPFLFDDYGNITENAALRVTSLDYNELKHGALSGHAGPLKRPVAMLSFALNYWLAGSYDSFSFKATNVFIQGICGYFLYLFCTQLFIRVNALNKGHRQLTNPSYAAIVVSIIWVTHPINLTSVLYVVQRMTSLSTLFTLATLTFYLYARNTQASSNKDGSVKIVTLLTSSIICFLFAIFSKENAMLIPLYILIIEWVLFSKKTPWNRFQHYSTYKKRILLGCLLFSASALLIYSINYALPGYASRHFSFFERILTETRVVIFYLSLITIPRINAFGLFHDDIPLSTSLVTPWSTIPSILVIITLIGIAFHLRKSKPIISLGLLIFFSGHLLESTIFALQIAHEHRNHFPSTGVIIALAGIIIHADKKLCKHKLVILTTGVVFILSATTFLRANEWESQYSLSRYESSHHPDSPATLTMLSTAAYKAGRPSEALKAIIKAEKLAPFETAHSISHASLLALQHKDIPDSLQKNIITKLQENTLTPSTEMTISHISKHIHRKSYKNLRSHYIEWLEALVDKLNNGRKSSSYYYFLAKGYIANGNIIKGLNAYQRSHELDALYINPLIEMGNIFLALKQTDNAHLILNTIVSKSKNLERDYSHEISELEKLIHKIETKKQLNALEQ